MLEALVRKHEIMPEFLEVVRCFQDKTCNVEEAYSGALSHKTTLHRRGLSPKFVLIIPYVNPILFTVRRNGNRFEVS